MAQAIERVDENALLDFFFAPAPGKPKPKGKVTPKKPKLDIPQKPKAFRINPRKGGFTVAPADPIDATKLPIDASVTVAYDLLDGNPFKKYNPIDFDLNDLQTSVKGVTITQKKNNQLRFEITDLDFRIEVTGFDDRRDLLVKGAAEEI